MGVVDDQERALASCCQRGELALYLLQCGRQRSRQRCGAAENAWPVAPPSRPRTGPGRSHEWPDRRERSPAAAQAGFCPSRADRRARPALGRAQGRIADDAGAASRLGDGNVGRRADRLAERALLRPKCASYTGPPPCFRRMSRPDPRAARPRPRALRGHAGSRARRSCLGGSPEPRHRPSGAGPPRSSR